MPNWLSTILIVVVALLIYDRFVKNINFGLGAKHATATPAVPASKTLDQLAIESIMKEDL